MKFFVPLIAAFFISIITIVGDFLIKEASLHEKFSGWVLLLSGAAIYGLTALGWFFVMRRAELSILGAIYSLTSTIALFLLGALLYKEHVTALELVGLGLGIASLVILFRVA